MIKTLLPLMLLTAPVHAQVIAPKHICNELLDVMTEHVMEGELEHKEAWAIYKRCLAIS